MTNRDRTLLNRMICGMICILPLLLLRDCTKVPDYCSAHNPLDPFRQFCYEGATVDKCGGNVFDPLKQFCHEEAVMYKCGGDKFDPLMQFCYEETVVDKCGGKDFNPSKQVCNDGIVKNQTAYLSVYIDPAGGGTVSFDPPSSDGSTNQNYSKYGYGLRTPVTVTAKPDGDNEFIGWSGAETETSEGANVTVMMDGDDMTLTAKFKMKYTVTVSGGGAGATGGGSYAAGEMVTITAGTAPTDKVFKNWTTASSGVTFADANSDTTTFTMPTNNVAVTAVFGAPPNKCGTDGTAGLCKTEVIDGKTWMAENLNYATLSGSWCYGDDNSKCNEYGRLYDWNTAMTACPSGWHLPSNQEWDALVTAAGGSSTAGTALKSTSGWYNVGVIGRDTYGFSALPGGYRDSNGTFDNAGDIGFWWTATDGSDEYAYRRSMYYNYDVVGEGYSYKSYGFAVRCVQN